MKRFLLLALLLLAAAAASCALSQPTVEEQRAAALRDYDNAQKQGDLFAYLEAVSGTPVKTVDYIYYPHDPRLPYYEVPGFKTTAPAAQAEFKNRPGVKALNDVLLPSPGYKKLLMESGNKKWVSYIGGIASRELLPWAEQRYPLVRPYVFQGVNVFEYNGQKYLYQLESRLPDRDEIGLIIFLPGLTENFLNDRIAFFDQIYRETEQERLEIIKSGYGNTSGMEKVVDIFEMVFSDQPGRYTADGVVSTRPLGDRQFESVVMMTDHSTRSAVTMLVRTSISKDGVPSAYERFPVPAK